MRNTYLARFLLFALALAIPAPAALIAVYTAPGDSMRYEEMRSLAFAVRQNSRLASDPRFTLLTSDSAVLTPEFSVPPGVSAYFLTEESLRHAGFVMSGSQAYFEGWSDPVPVTADSSDSAGATPVAPEIVWVTAFQGAFIQKGQLQLHYTLSAPGRVSAEAHGMDGRSLGRWNWNEGRGPHSRSLDLKKGSQGPVLVQWNYGKLRVIHRILGQRSAAP